MSILIFIIILGILIFVHELGHFTIAKLFGIRVDEFGMGLPPRAIRLFKRGETEYTLNWIPFGGFVKIYGEDSLEKGVDDPDYNRSLISKKWWQQILVLVAGVTMNVIVAWIIISGILFFHHGRIATGDGNPFFKSAINKNYEQKIAKGWLKDPAAEILYVGEETPADIAGILPSDVIRSMNSNGKLINNPTQEQFIEMTKTSEGKTLHLLLERNGTLVSKDVAPLKNPDGVYVVGVGISDSVILSRLPFFTALGNGALSIGDLVWSTLSGLGNLFTGGTQLSDVTGPVGLAAMFKTVYKSGMLIILEFVVFVSMALAVINILPFPALDGGRVLFVIIEKIIRRPLPKKFVEWSNGIGFMLLIGLMIVVTIKDVIHLF